MNSVMSNDAILIEIDNELQPIVPGFLESRWKDCMLIDAMLMDGRMDDIAKLGHRLKGAGGSYGFDFISDIGIALERAAATQDRESIALESKNLRRYLERITIIYI